MATTLSALQSETGANPVASIIVLHGLGADGRDFLPIAQELDLSAVGPVRFIFPNAPIMPITVNGGYPMPAWYDIVGADITSRQDEVGLRRSQAAVEALISHEKSRGIAANRIVLMGFSQGCAMALMTGLRHAEMLAGIAGLSGYLPLASLTAAERSPASQRMPIFMAHGTRDGIVPMARASDSRDALKAMGYSVEWHSYPMEHSVCPEEITDLQQWLCRVLTT